MEVRMRVKGVIRHQNTLDEILNEIKFNDNFIITFHMPPDYDSVGSALAMFYILRKIGKNALVVSEEDNSVIKKNFSFLPLHEEIKEISVLNDLNPGDYTLISLDSGEEKRLGRTFSKDIGKFKKVINIDHHYDNNLFGDVNYIDSEVSGTGEIIYRIVELLNIELNKELATLIYASIVEDSGSFRFDSTKPSTHLIAAKLLETGIKASFFTKNMYQNKSIDFVKFEGELFTNIKTALDNKIVWVVITNEILNKYNLSDSDTEPVVEDIGRIKDCKVYFTIKEKIKRGLITVALRSKDDTDVSKVAQKFGGGGHKSASGISFDISLGLENVEKKIVEELKEIV